MRLFGNVSGNRIVIAAAGNNGGLVSLLQDPGPVKKSPPERGHPTALAERSTAPLKKSCTPPCSLAVLLGGGFPCFLQLGVKCFLPRRRVRRLHVIVVEQLLQDFQTPFGLTILDIDDLECGLVGDGMR